MRLLIDGKEVALDKDLSIEYVVSNPFLTKDGGYTLDISVNLNNPANAILYGNLQRMDVKAYPKNRSAIIECDGRMVIQGSEIILSVENGIAKIQIVEGNSELNYLSSERENIRDIPNIGVSSYVIPVLTGLVELNGMQRIITFNYNPTISTQAHHYCPKLLGVINDVVRDAGFEVGNNVLEDVTEYDDLYIVPEKIVAPTTRAEDTLFKEFLPGWSANEFFTEIEKFFNVVFIKKGNKVNIQSLNEYFSDDTNKVYIADEDVIDNFNKEFGVDCNLYTNYANVRYDLPANKYYKYADLNMDIRNKCSTTFFFDSLPSNDSAGQYTIFRAMLYLYGIVRKKLTLQNGTDKYLLMQCLQFQRHIHDIDAAETLLRIIPAQIVATGLSSYEMSPYIGDIDFETFVINNTSTSSTGSLDITLNEEIENGVQKENLPTRLRIAFMSTEPSFISKPGSVHNTQRYPYSTFNQSWTSPYVVCSSVADENEQVFANTSGNKNLGLDYRYEHFYRTNVNVDTSVEYTIRFKNKKIIHDAKAIFYIRNMAFYCKQIKYTLDKNGVTEIAEGIFYKIK